MNHVIQHSHCDNCFIDFTCYNCSYYGFPCLNCQCYGHLCSYNCEPLPKYTPPTPKYPPGLPHPPTYTITTNF